MQVRVHIFMVFMVMDLLLWPGYIYYSGLQDRMCVYLVFRRLSFALK